MDFSHPIDGWDFVLSTAVGIVTTILSVWIGLRAALKHERKRAESEHIKEEVALGRDIVSDGLKWGDLNPMSFPRAFLELTYPVHNESPGDIMPPDRWDPAKFLDVASKTMPDMPRSQQAVVDWADAKLAEFVEIGNRDFPNATIGVVQYVARRYSNEIEGALNLYVKGRRGVEWFLRHDEPGTHQPEH